MSQKTSCSELSGEKRKFFTVLSIDGGGIRGIIPALILEYIEEEMRQQLSKCNKPCQLRIANFFDLIAGTSTGGLIALALTKPDSSRKPAYAAKDLVTFYKTEGENIFNASTAHYILSGNGWINKKYPADGIEKVLKRYFGCIKLCQATTNVLIPSYDMRGARVHWRNQFDCRRGGHPRFFKNYNTSNSEQRAGDCQQQSKECNPNDSSPARRHEDNYLMRDVARATSAAPTFFPPVDLYFNPEPELKLVETLVDGGIFANNPAMCAYADAQKIMRRDKRRNDDILFVSLGTGNLTETLPASDAKNWGKLRWADTLIKMIFDGASDTVNYQLRQLINTEITRVGGAGYSRFQPQLTYGSNEMDDVSEVNLLELEAVAKKFIKKNRCSLNAISQRLLENGPKNQLIQF